MSECIERLIANTVHGARETQLNIANQELEFEVFFNYLQQNLGDLRLFDKSGWNDNFSFNMERYKPTKYGVPPGLCNNMSSIGLDFIRQHTSSVSRSPRECWVIFKITDTQSPLYGVTYTTAYSLHTRELIYPSSNPAFVKNYPASHVYEQSRGVFIDSAERFLKLTRPELYQTDLKGRLVK